MNKPKFNVGDIVTLKLTEKDFHFTGRDSLLKHYGYTHPSLLCLPELNNIKIKARVKSVNANFVKDSYEILVLWLDVPAGAHIPYTMLESEFYEFYDDSIYVTFKGTSEYPISAKHIKISAKYNPLTFEEINPETNLSFTPKPLVTNKIVNSKEIENFLLIS